MSHLIHKRDRSDERDLHFTPASRTLPASASLHEFCPPVYNQLPLHSCSAHAISAAMLMTASMNGQQIQAPSRLFLYYNARARDGEAALDDGATIRTALKAAASDGASAETLWPYDTAKVFDRPAQAAYDTKNARVLEYRAVERDLHLLRACIAERLPVIFGINMYDSVVQNAAKTGVLAMPQANDQLMGGHAILAVGYDDASKTILALNSCGTDFGDQGYLHVPYDYFGDDKLTYDFWTIHKIG